MSSGEKKKSSVEYSKEVGGAVLLKISGIDDRDEAEKIKGANVFVHKDSLPILDDQSYYIFDLVGMTVYDKELNIVGVIQRVEEFPSNDVLVIEKESEEIWYNLFVYF